MPHDSTVETKERQLFIPKMYPDNTIVLSANVHSWTNMGLSTKIDFNLDNHGSIGHIIDLILNNFSYSPPSFIPIWIVLTFVGRPQILTHIRAFEKSSLLTALLPSHSCMMIQEFMNNHGLPLGIRLWSSFFSIKNLKMSGSTSWTMRFLGLHQIPARAVYKDLLWIGFSVTIFQEG